MSCEKIRDKLAFQVTMPDLSPELREHVRACPACAAWYEDLRQDDKRLASLAEARKNSLAPILAKVVAALPAHPLPRKKLIPARLKIGLAAVFSLCSGLALLYFFTQTNALAFSQVIAHLHTPGYAYVYSQPGLTLHVMCGAGVCRIENPEPNSLLQTITIFDYTRRKSLVLDPEHKTGFFIDLEKIISQPNEKGFSSWPGMNFGQGAPSPQELIGNLDKGTSTPLPNQVVEGRLCAGFRVHYQSDLISSESTLWADIETGRPVRVEVEGYFLKEPQQKIGSLIDNFEYGLQFPPELFSLEPPPGYTMMEEQEMLPFDPEDIGRKMVEFFAEDEPHAPEAAGEPTDLALQIMRMLDHAGRKEFDEAVAILIQLDFSGPAVFPETARYFHASAKELFSSAMKTPGQKSGAEILKSMTELQAPGQGAMDLYFHLSEDPNYSKTPADAEKHFLSLYYLGRLLDRGPGSLADARQTGLFLQDLALLDLSYHGFPEKHDYYQGLRDQVKQTEAQFEAEQAKFLQDLKGLTNIFPRKPPS